MKDLSSSNRLGFRAVAMVATAIAAVAFAIGVLTIRRLPLGRVLVESAEFKSGVASLAAGPGSEHRGGGSAGNEALRMRPRYELRRLICEAQSS
jgi:hypothetical protein